MKSQICLGLVLLMLVSITGCTITDGGAIVTGNTRSAVPVEEVRLYRVAPESYDEIAIVSSSAGHDFRKNSGLIDSAIERLKEEAAKLGANGVLLTEVDERDAPSVTTGYGYATATGGGTSVFASGNSIGVNRGDSYTRVSAIAIYVKETRPYNQGSGNSEVVSKSKSIQECIDVCVANTSRSPEVCFDACVD